MDRTRDVHVPHEYLVLQGRSVHVHSNLGGR